MKETFFNYYRFNRLESYSTELKNFYIGSRICSNKRSQILSTARDKRKVEIRSESRGLSFTAYPIAGAWRQDVLNLDDASECPKGCIVLHALAYYASRRSGCLARSYDKRRHVPSCIVCWLVPRTCSNCNIPYYGQFRIALLGKEISIPIAEIKQQMKLS